MAHSAPHTTVRQEAPTVFLLVVCYAGWALGTTWLFEVSPILAVFLVTLTTVLHASLTHEVLHGHPTRNRHLNAALVFPALSVAVPYMRFRDTHLAHHRDERLTDPYDDPESHFMDPAAWSRLPTALQGLLRWNNALLGRLLIGPVIGQISFMAGDLRLIRGGNMRVLVSWLWHLPAVGLVVGWIVYLSPMSGVVWAACVYAALSILKIRTFLEHRAHPCHRARTAIVEGQGLLSFLFLNNNLHVVHHMHPKTPWHQLPKLYKTRQTHYQRRNDGYVYRSYGQIFRAFLLRAKDPVPHPLWPKR